MIISVSRRTDVPARYSDWFFTRLREGYALVRNPLSPRQVSRIFLDRGHVDGFVFWTKNPIPMMGRLGELEDFPYYFHFTLNAYGADAEPGVPEKKGVLVPAFQELSRRIGRERVLWRYDPVFLNDRYTPAYHVQYFRALAAKLGEYTEVCTVSFVDMYKKTVRNARSIGVREAGPEEQKELIRSFAETARRFGFVLRVCAEPQVMEHMPETEGAEGAKCIDAARLARIGGIRLAAPKDRNQRQGCACDQSMDIGAYDTCPNGCLYCYANANHARAAKNAALHDPQSPLLFGSLGQEDRVYDRQMPLFAVRQMSME